jgi:D-alanyl-lipoteichoic acid acyltransferase DltB (MBOAT superfamily)
MTGCDLFLGPLREMPWEQWNFWRNHVFEARHLAFWFLPLVPLAALLARKNVHLAWTGFSLAFSVWAFGPVFTLFLLCFLLLMYRLSEAFARECRRTDIHPAAPLVVMVLIVVASFWIYAGVRRLGPGPGGLAWVRQHAAWLLPMGLKPPEGLKAPSRGVLETILITPHFCGIAFLTLKLIHYLAEIRRGTLGERERSLSRFLSYCTFAPSFIQGPIDRYPHFVDQIEHAAERWRPSDLLVGLWRIAVGIIKKLVAVAWIEGWGLEHAGFLRAPFEGMQFKEFYFRHPDQLPYAYLWLGIWAMTLEIYLEFSGYCDLAVGMARLTGFRMTEAFRLPWISSSLLEFWRRWNITVGLWLRDYVYIPLGGSRRHVYRNYCVTFMVCGIWHIPNGTLAIWGLMLGTALAINRAWRELWSSTPGRIRVPAMIQQVAQKAWPLWRIGGIILTANTFCLLLLVFFKDLPSGAKVFWQIVSRPLKALLF